MEENVNVIELYTETIEHLSSTTEKTSMVEQYAAIAEQARMYVNQQDGCLYMVRGEGQ